jgi:TRAP-type uncharacterized transport system substrate-binding protein
MFVRAKFTVSQSSKDSNGVNIVTLNAVTEGSEENAKFFSLTPSGTIDLAVINDETAATFVAGQEVYVDFTPVKVTEVETKLQQLTENPKP